MDPQIDGQVAKVLSGLKKVNAPENFEGRVLARLSLPPEARSGFALLKLAVPTAALAALALFLILSGYLGSEVPTVDVATTPVENGSTLQQPPAPQDAVVVENNVQPPSEFHGPETAEIRPSPEAAQTTSKSKKRLGGNNSYDIPSDGKGSYDIGSGTDTRIMPKGFDTNSRPVSDPATERQIRRPSIMVSDVLRYMGASGEFRENGWLVGPIVPNSVAARLGLKPGDVIVSLNDVRVGKTTTFPSGVDIKLVRVSRNGSFVDLKF